MRNVDACKPLTNGIVDKNDKIHLKHEKHDEEKEQNAESKTENEQTEKE